MTRHRLMRVAFCIWKAAPGTGGRSSLPTGCMPRSTRRPLICNRARTRPAAGPSAMATSGGFLKTRRATLPRSGSGASKSMSIRSARWSSSRPARSRILKTRTTKPSSPSVPSRGQLRVTDAHAPPGSEHFRKGGQHVPAAARPKTTSVAPLIPLVVGKVGHRD